MQESFFHENCVDGTSYFKPCGASRFPGARTKQKLHSIHTHTKAGPKPVDKLQKKSADADALHEEK